MSAAGPRHVTQVTETRARIVTASISLAMIAGCSAPGPEPSATTASSITAGTDDSSDSAVALLLVGTELGCTATLIAPDVLLTAAHCVTPQVPTAAHFGSTPDDDGPTLAVASVVAHPSFDPDTYANDVGVVFLSEPASATPAAYASSPLGTSLAGQSLRLVGWGVDAAGGSPRVKRSGTTRVLAEDGDDFSFDADPSSTCYGDSGGPAFAAIDGAEVLVGVTSSGDMDCTNGRDMRVDAYAGFITPLVASQASARGATHTGSCAVAAPGSPGAPGAPWALLFFLALATQARSPERAQPESKRSS